MVQHSVQGLSYLLLESSRQNLNETDFLDSILTLAFPPAINQGLRDVRARDSPLRDAANRGTEWQYSSQRVYVSRVCVCLS